MFYPGLRAPEPGRERDAQPAQHLSHPRRAGARCQRLGAATSNEALRSLRPKSRRGVRPAPLAGMGQRARARLPRQAARSLQVSARPDAAAHEPRTARRPRSPSGSRCPRASRRRGTCAATTARCSHNAEGRLPALPRLVRRQPGQPQSAAPGGARTQVRGVHGRGGGGDQPRARGLRAGRVPLRGRGHEPRGVRGSVEHGARAGSAPTRWSSSATRSESATWRNAYLLGALRAAAGPRRCDRARSHRPRRAPRHEPRPCSSISSACGSTPRRPKARRIVINWVFPEPAPPYVLNLENCALTYLAGPPERARRRDRDARARRAGPPRSCGSSRPPTPCSQGAFASTAISPSSGSSWACSTTSP